MKEKSVLIRSRLMNGRMTIPLSALFLGLLPLSGCSKEKPAPAPEVASPKAAKSDTLPTGQEDKKPIETPVEPPKGEKPAYTVTAVGITEEFSKNYATAEKKYKDKLIEVEGTVLSAYQNKVRHVGGVALIGFRKRSEDSLPQLVKCDMKTNYSEKVGLLGKGQKVRVKGKFAGASGGDVTLADAGYEELTPSSVPRLTAVAMAKEFEQDPSGATKKYNEKDVIVRGVVSDLVAKDGQFIVKLEGTGKVRISGIVDEDELKTLKKGDQVGIKGELSVIVPGDVVITSAFLVEKGS